MASIQKTQNGYRAFLYVQGYRASKQFPTRSAAKNWAVAKETELRKGPTAFADLYDPTDQPIPSVMRYEDPTIETLSEIEILGASRSVAKVCGVYFLIENDAIVYVGQSIEVYSRLSAHFRSFTFDRVTIVECPRERLDSLELLYIQKFSPKHNKDGKLKVLQPDS